METLESILAEHKFFKDLEPGYLDLIVSCASNVRIDPDKYIFREGGEANEFFLIRQGLVSLQISGHNSGPITIQTLGDGDIIGWSWLFPPYHWRFDAWAEKLTRAIALDGKCLRTKCEEDHNFGYELLKRFTKIIDRRLRETRLQLLDIYGKD